MGRFEEAIEQFEIRYEGLLSEPRDALDVGNGAADKTDVTGPDPESLNFLGYAYGVVGEQNKALEVLGELMELRKKRYVQPHNVATVYIGLDGLRSDPRFDESIRRLG